MFDRRGKFIEIADVPFSKRFRHVDNADAALELAENVVRVSSDTAAVTITLPDVTEAAGLSYDVHALNGTTNAVTVNDAEGNNVTSSTISIDDGFVLVTSSGMNWRVLAETLA